MTKVQELDFTGNTLIDHWSTLKEDFWGDLKTQTLQALKKLLETTMELQVQDLIGARRWKHHLNRSTYRNGAYSRNLLTSLGYLTSLKIPRVREGNPCTVIPRYQQRTNDIDKTVLEMFLAGTSTRRIEEVLEPLVGPKALSSSTVSRITKVLDSHVRRFHNRLLPDTYEYLLLDGIYLNTKSILHSKRRCVLAVYGIMANGLKELIDFELASHGESRAAWERFLNRLYHRGLTGNNLKLAILDGNKGSWNALNLVYPHVARQRCWAHKLRNVASNLPRKIQKECLAEAKAIYRASSKQEALKLFKNWARFWRRSAPGAVHCLELDIEHLLHFYDCPKPLWIKLRTTNIIERIFREVRRRTRPMSCLQNPQSLERILYAVFFRLNAKWRQKTLRQITQKV